MTSTTQSHTESEDSSTKMGYCGTTEQSTNESVAEVDLVKEIPQKNTNVLPFSEANGQRRYGPPPNWIGAPPGRGTEVFVGHLPRHLPNDQLLIDVFGRLGQIYEIRVMVDFAGNNRGYCFVVYASRITAQTAVDQLHDTEILPGHTIGVMPSVDNRRLFIGGIPRSRTSQELKDQLNKMVSGICDVIQYASATDKSKNRGFAFVEFGSHKAAALARQKLLRDKVTLWGAPLCVDWAEPEADVDESTMQQVRILYLRNLLLTTTEDEIREIFGGLSKDPTSIERVKKIKDFAFVHFRLREDAEHVLRKINEIGGLQIQGVPIEVVWAKPPDRSIMRHVRSCMKNLQLLPSGNAYYKAIVDDASRSMILSQQVNQTVTQMPYNNMFYTMGLNDPTNADPATLYSDVPADLRHLCGQPLYQTNASAIQQQLQQAALKRSAPLSPTIRPQTPPIQPPFVYPAQQPEYYQPIIQQPMQFLPTLPPPQVYITQPNFSQIIYTTPTYIPILPYSIPTATTTTVNSTATTTSTLHPHQQQQHQPLQQHQQPPDLISTHVPASRDSSHVSALRRISDEHNLGHVSYTFRPLENGLVQCLGSYNGQLDLCDPIFLTQPAFHSRHDAQEYAALQALLRLGASQ